MQRRGTDGDWVGESAPYTFDIKPAAAATTAPTQAPAPAAVPPRHDPVAAPPQLAATGTTGRTALAALGLTTVGAALLTVARRRR
jgi:LPXTG-motif cell wall-anchored protein